MSYEKTMAILLKSQPFKESSLIVYFFTQSHGLIHGILKGAKRSKSSQRSIERGYLCEIIFSLKPNRDLHPITNLEIIDFYPSIRTDIVKSSLRDVAFEIIIKTITNPDIHPELYSLIVNYCSHLDTSPTGDTYPTTLWLFFYRFCQHMGFSLHITNCITCNKQLTENVSINIPHGGVQCAHCSTEISTSLLSSTFIHYLQKGHPSAEDIVKNSSKESIHAITTTLFDYIRYHCEIKYQLHSLNFLLTII